MKSEQRHQLETNVLADKLGKGIESTRSAFPFVFGGIAVVVIVGLIWGIYSGITTSKSALAWTDYYFKQTSSDADSFIDVADANPNLPAGHWARFAAGINLLDRGIEAIYRNRSEGEELIGDAISSLEKVKDEATNLELRSKALLALGQAKESLGKIEEAIDYYTQVTKNSTNPYLTSSAGARLGFLSTDGGKEFYTWFTKLDPKPDAPIQLPDDLKTPPLSPDIQFSPTSTDTSAAEVPGTTQLEPSPDISESTVVVPDLPVINEVAAPETEVPPTPTLGDEPTSSNQP